MTKFEYFPNEILIRCFEYLNAPDLLYAFEQVNPRFYRLIRTIPLRVNFENISKSIFDRFCDKMFDYTEIQKQIYSLKLSNANTHGQISAFFTYFSLDEFVQLRSLTLLEIKENDLEQLSSILPSLTQLTCLRLVRSLETSDVLISKLPRSKLSSSFQEMISLTRLSVKFGMLNQYYQLLLDMPFLQYLCISRGLQFDSMSSADINLLRGRINHLKYLIIDDCILINTDNLMDVISHMINLQSLTVSTYENSEIINAYRWQHLITSSLPNLNMFRFKFGSLNRDEIVHKYSQFQTDFWIVQHKWYTECILAEDGSQSSIFTIPYLNNGQPIWLKCTRHFNTLVDNSKTFNNVKILYAPGEEMNKSNEFYFPNNQSLLIQSSPISDNEYDEQRFFTSVKRTMNLSNLNHLQIPICCQPRGSTILLKILKEAPQLSSLNIPYCTIDIFKTNKELCRYTTQMIKKLQLSKDVCSKSHDMISVHQLFPNIEEMTSYISKPDICLLLLNNLPKLSTLNVTFHHSRDFSPFNAVKNELSKLKSIFFYENIQFRVQHVAIITFGFWVDRDS